MKILGGIMLAIGILVAGASGLCSLVMLYSMGADPEGFWLVLLFGGIPFTFGAGLFIGGLALIRHARRQ